MKAVLITLGALLSGVLIGNQLPRFQLLPIGSSKASFSSDAAADKSTFSWKEPESFMGFKFFTDITASINECRKEKVGSTAFYKTYDSSQGVCWEKTFGGYYTIRYTELFTKIDAHMVERKLAYLELDFHWQQFPKIFAVFKERYGKPTQIVEEKWTSLGGVTVPNQIATWKGEKLLISLRQRAGKIDRGGGEIITDLWRQHTAKTTKEWAKDKAKDL